MQAGFGTAPRQGVAGWPMALCQTADSMTHRTVCTAVSARSEREPLVGQGGGSQPLQIEPGLRMAASSRSMNDRSPFRPVLARSYCSPSIAQRNRLGSRRGVGRARDRFPPLLDVCGSVAHVPAGDGHGLWPVWQLTRRGPPASGLSPRCSAKNCHGFQLLPFARCVIVSIAPARVAATYKSRSFSASRNFFSSAARASHRLRMRQKRRRLPALCFAEDGQIPADPIARPVDVQVHVVLGLAGRVRQEHDRRLQSLDLVQVHNADSRRLREAVPARRRASLPVPRSAQGTPPSRRPSTGRPAACAASSMPLARLPAWIAPPATMPASTVSPRSATIFSMAATGGILASHRAYFLSRSKAS